MTRGFGWAPDPWRETPEPTRFGASRSGAVSDGVTHEDKLEGIHNQGDSNSCVGQSFSQAIQLTLTLKQGKLAPKPSARWIWNMTRLREGTLTENVGIFPTNALRILKGLGYPTEKHYPFEHNAAAWHDKPGEEVSRNAYDQRTVRGYRVVKETGAKRVAELSAGLDDNQIIVFGQDVGQVFCDHVGPEPLGVPVDEIVGKHMMAIVGFRKRKSGTMFRVLNSWGEDWGDGGLWWAKEEVILWKNSTDFIAVDVDDLPSS